MEAVLQKRHYFINQNKN